MAYKMKKGHYYALCFAADNKEGTTRVHLNYHIDDNKDLLSQKHMSMTMVKLGSLIGQIQESKEFMIQDLEENEMHAKRKPSATIRLLISLAITRMESLVTISFTVKFFALLIFACIQGVVFYSLIEKNIGEFTKSVLPI